MTPYDAWKLASPPEAEEEDLRTECTEVNDDGVECDFDAWTRCQIAGDVLTWTCPKCGHEHVDGLSDRYVDDN